mmetsp:Transcript_7516/g.19267  ORF Transcript_7516/g.19267 Transcript_7516/m.19267 type:complete len:204 (-) Transcript_7516:92-703(-)
MLATDDRHLGNFRRDGNATRIGQHRRQRSCGGFDRVNALAVHSADERYGRPIASQPAHLNLWIGRLFVQLGRDDAPDGLGCVACRADTSRIGHENEARPVDLHLIQHSLALRLAGQQAIIHVFPNGQTQRVAGPDRVRAKRVRIQEPIAEAKGGLNGGCAGDPVIHGHNESIAGPLHGSFIDLALVGANAWQATGRNHGHNDQ